MLALKSEKTLLVACVHLVAEPGRAEYSNLLLLEYKKGIDVLSCSDIRSGCSKPRIVPVTSVISYSP